MVRGLLCIGTGRYSQLVPTLEANVARHRAADVMFCLTDDASLLAHPTRRAGEVTALRLPWGALPWPLPTLYRYHAISMYADLIRERATHLVYCDVDMRVVGDIGLLYQDTLVAVKHPGYWSADPSNFPYENDPRSEACCTPSASSVYVAGGVQGGPAEAYLAAAAECARAVSADHRLGVTARWHDESHWNRFVSTRADVRLLGPEYCWPESWAVPAGLPTPRILALDKDHHALRGTRTVGTRVRRLLQSSPRAYSAARLARDIIQSARMR